MNTWTAVPSLAFVVVSWLPRPADAGRKSDEPVRSREPSVVEARLFKDGYAWVTMAVDLSGRKAGQEAVVRLPYVVHGTLWAEGKTPDEPLPAIRFSSLRTAKPRPIRDLTDALVASVGTQVSLVMADGRTVSGVVKKCLALDAVSTPSGARRAGQAYAHEPSRVPVHTTVHFVLVSDGKVTHLVKGSQIKEVSFAGDITDVSATAIEEGTALAVSVEDGKAKKLLVHCATKGLTWAPSYRLDMTDERSARLSCQALVCNELADLEGTKVFLTGGVPNIALRQIASPAMTTWPLATFLNALATGFDLDRLGEARAGLHRGRGGERIRTGVSEAGQALMGGVADVQFAFPLGKISLRAGERSQHRLFSAAVAVTPFHLWSIPDNIDPNDRYVGPARSQAHVGRRTGWYAMRQARQWDPGAEILWSALEFENTSGKPWTTAPIIVTRAGALLGQDLLSFAAAGEKATVQVSRALDVRAQQHEDEIKSQSVPHPSGWRKVTYQGRIALQSMRAKPVTMRIVKACSGNVLSTSDKATTEERIGQRTSWNKRHLILWEFELAARASKELHYSYEAIVSR